VQRKSDYTSSVIHRVIGHDFLCMLYSRRHVLDSSCEINVVDKPRFNDRLYNDVLGITNDCFYPSNSKTCGKEPR